MIPITLTRDDCSVSGSAGEVTAEHQDASIVKEHGRIQPLDGHPSRREERALDGVVELGGRRAGGVPSEDEGSAVQECDD